MKLLQSKLILLIFFIFNLNLSNISAATVDNLYNSTIYLEPHQLANNKTILQQGMLQVLIKVSGISKVDQNPIIATALKQPEKYLYKYSQSIKEQFDQETRSFSKQRVSAQHYQSDKINSLLKEAGISVWGNQRPMTLSWVMIEFDPQNRVIINDSDYGEVNNNYKQLVNDIALSRGLPFTLPIQDLSEQMAISPAVIWSQFPDDLQQASARYGVDAIFSASIQNKNNQLWQGRWLLIKDLNHNRKLITYTSEAHSLSESMTQGINWLADNLVKGYTMPSNIGAGAELIELNISGINNINEYIKLENHLKNISALDLENIKLSKLGTDSVSFIVSADHGIKTLKQAIELDSKLVIKKPNNVNSNFDSVDTRSNIDITKKENNFEVLQLRWR